MAETIPIPITPAGIQWVYIGEGAANVVYRMLVLLPRTPLPGQLTDRVAQMWDYQIRRELLQKFEGKLVRLRKDLPTTIPCIIAQDLWLRHIAPLIPPHHLVQQTLIRIRPNLIDELNVGLLAFELRTPIERPFERHGVFLADDDYGLLITSMITDEDNEYVIQFKPKWLVQSPSAPANSKRCRHCAHVAFTNSQHPSAGLKERKRVFCPFDLLSNNPQDHIRVARQLLFPHDTETKVPRFANWIGNNTLIPLLRNLQANLDSTGPLKFRPNDANFLTAMTLRDCTVYIKFSTDWSLEPEARIGDLDLKSPLKADYWRKTEEQLIRGGWYEGLEGTDEWQELSCALSRVNTKHLRRGSL